MKIRRKYMQEIVDVLHEVLLYFDCDCQSNDRRCDYCQNTTQKVHTILGNMGVVGIIDDNNRIKDRPKDEWRQMYERWIEFAFDRAKCETKHQAIVTLQSKPKLKQSLSLEDI